MRRLLTWVSVSVLAVAIMLLFNIGNDSLLWSAVQNMGHFLIFAALSYCYLALFRIASLSQPLMHVAAVLTLLSLGGLIELVQSAMPSRTASWSDLLLDAAGIVMGYLIFFSHAIFACLARLAEQDSSPAVC